MRKSGLVGCGSVLGQGNIGCTLVGELDKAVGGGEFISGFNWNRRKASRAFTRDGLAKFAFWGFIWREEY